jgi:hypothetical protein
MPKFVTVLAAVAVIGAIITALSSVPIYLRILVPAVVFGFIILLLAVKPQNGQK